MIHTHTQANAQSQDEDWGTNQQHQSQQFKSLCKSSLFCYPFFCHFWLTFFGCVCACYCFSLFFSRNFSKFAIPDTLNSNITLTNGLSMCGHDAELKCHKWEWCSIMTRKKSFVFLYIDCDQCLNICLAIRKRFLWDGLAWLGMAWHGMRCWVFFKSGSFRLNMQIS